MPSVDLGQLPSGCPNLHSAIGIAPTDFRDLRDGNRSFETLAATFQWSANLTGGEAERVQGMKVYSPIPQVPDLTVQYLNNNMSWG